MDKELFLYIIANQTKWAEEYRLQKKEQIKQFNKATREKVWYGNSKEYMKLWRKNGAQINK
jgi:hypothetical protein